MLWLLILEIMTVLRRLMAVVTVMRASIYEVTHEREAALNFAPPRFRVEKTHKLLWKLRKTAFILFLWQPQLDPERDSLVFFHDSVWPHPGGLAVLLRRKGLENVLQFPLSLWPTGHL